MVTVHNFSYGLLTPVLGYLISCLGCFLGLRCTSRARACQGATKARWLALAAVAIGSTGVWAMHFIAMLGYTIPGQTIRYNVPITVLSMLIAVVVVGVGLFIVGFGGDGVTRLLIGGVIIGCGVASMHYMGMAAMRMPDNMHYNVPLVIVSVLIAVLAGTVALLAALRLAGIRITLVASLIMGVAVSGMHYTGMAAMHLTPATASMPGMLSGATATGVLLPLIIGISILAFGLAAVIGLSPSDEEIRAEDALMRQLARGPRGAEEPAGRPTSSWW
jgi:NO-binding membrane sensor protein with MHYT domain